MKIAIAGFRLEGRSNYSYYAAQGGHDITIVDDWAEITNLPDNVPTILGTGSLNHLQDFDMVMRTAGIDPAKIRTDGVIWSATKEFFDKCPAPIIGVTGTKGKGTTCSLIYEILKAEGKKAHLVGNIGVAALEELHNIGPGDIVVYELSSFQLWDLEKSPHVAVVLYMEPDHLDVHGDMASYVEAKTSIRRYQKPGDICFYHPDNEFSRRISETADSDTADRAPAVPYGIPQGSASPVAVSYVEGEDFCIRRPGSETVSRVPVSVLRIPGAHNRENACAAIDAALVFGVGDEAVRAGLNAFGGLSHRLMFVREIDGIKYYNDSISTTPGSTMAAMRAFDEPKVMIMGGSPKGAEYDEMAECAGKSNIRAIVAIGLEGDKIESAMREHGVLVRNLGGELSMPEILDVARGYAESGDAVVLSPACASFDMFKSYVDRGDQFVTAVEALDAAS